MNTKGLPIIITKETEGQFKRDGVPFNPGAFEKLIHMVICEQKYLVGKIKTITACTPPLHCHAEITFPREGGKPLWDNLEFHIYTDNRYLDEKLIRHEFKHLADRFDPSMAYYPQIDDGSWDCAMNIAANISVDVRLAGKGLTREDNQAEFQKHIEVNDKVSFENLWDDPPLTWRAIEDRAIQLRPLIKKPQRKEQ